MIEIVRDDIQEIILDEGDTLQVTVIEEGFFGYNKVLGKVKTTVDRARKINQIAVFDADEDFGMKDPFITVIGERQ